MSYKYIVTFRPMQNYKIFHLKLNIYTKLTQWC
jgi:hypothetical protein